MEDSSDNFLGPDFLCHPVVVGSTIPKTILNKLKANLIIEEIDEFMKQANKSVAGIDGLTNCFITLWVCFTMWPVYLIKGY